MFASKSALRPRLSLQGVEWSDSHMDTQFEIDTINAVPTPRFDVGENTFAAQLITSGNRL